MIIDCHGHYTTVPPGMRVFRALQISNMGRPAKGKVAISDDEIRSSLEQGQIRLLDERGIDLMLFSPTASAMGHHFGSATVSRHWTEVNNDLMHRVCALYPDRFVGVCALPQSPGVSPETASRSSSAASRGWGSWDATSTRIRPAGTGPIRRSATSGGTRSTRSSWRSTPPPMIHASATCNPAFHTTGSHYLNADSTAFLQLLESRVLKDFPTLRLVITHGGGNVPFQAARYRALSHHEQMGAIRVVRPALYFDTTVYGQEAMALLIKVVGVDNVLFASEMLGGVNAIDPTTGRWFDDNKPCVDALGWLTEEDRHKIFAANVTKAYPRLVPILEQRRLRTVPAGH